MESVSNESRPSAIQRNALRCLKCHALNPRDDLANKFCDQCGHRLQKVHPKPRQPRQRCEQEPSSCPTVVIPVATTSSESGWFWGPQELTLTSETAQKSSHEVDDWGDASLDNQAQQQYLPSKRPLHKTHTAHGAPREDRLDRLSLQQLRRVQSFGDSVSSLLPPLAHAPPRATTIAADQIKPNNAKSSTQKSAATTQIADANANANKPCALLWGHVLTDAIAEFESTSIVLTAEIDSDERCMSVLAQRLHLEETSRSKYVVVTTTSPLQFKLQELQKKVRINKEKLTMVHERLHMLSEQRKREECRGSGEPEHCIGEKPEPQPANSTSNQETDRNCGPADTQSSSPRERPTKKPPKKRKKNKKAKTTTSTSTADPITSTRPKSYDMEAAAIKIQQRFRVVRARRLFADMVKRAYQRVYDADAKRYFYYNPRTHQSQWEIPPALANVQLRTHHNRRAPSARSLHSAAARIQSLYRRRAARVALRHMLQQVYEKVYDAESDSYYYYCKTTKRSSWEKPKLLRDADLPSQAAATTTTTTSDAMQIAYDPQRTAAAVKIQELFRNRATRLFLTDLAGGSIEKHFDVDAQAWYYFNKRTQQSFWEQPRHASLL